MSAKDSISAFRTDARNFFARLSSSSSLALSSSSKAPNRWMPLRSSFVQRKSSKRERSSVSKNNCGFTEGKAEEHAEHSGAKSHHFGLCCNGLDDLIETVAQLADPLENGNSRFRNHSRRGIEEFCQLDDDLREVLCRRLLSVRLAAVDQPFAAHREIVVPAKWNSQ